MEGQPLVQLCRLYDATITSLWRIVTFRTVHTDTVVRIRESRVTLFDEVLLVLVLDRITTLRAWILHGIIGVKRREIWVGLVVNGWRATIRGAVRVRT